MISLPVWFSGAFEHLDKQDADTLKHLWETEPVLRDAVARLDTINPALHPTTHCPARTVVVSITYATVATGNTVAWIACGRVPRRRDPRLQTCIVESTTFCMRYW